MTPAHGLGESWAVTRIAGAALLILLVVVGLASATLLVLYVLPVLYVAVSRRFGDITGGDQEPRAPDGG